MSDAESMGQNVTLFCETCQISIKKFTMISQNVVEEFTHIYIFVVVFLSYHNK